MSSGPREVNRRELLRLIVVVSIAWVAILVVLAQWQQRHPGDKRAQLEPELRHYPGTEGVAEQTSVNLGFRKYWFMLNEEYPSKSVYFFYKTELGQKGWRLVNPREPQWYRRTQGDKVYDLFTAVWLSPDRLFQVELEMKSEVKPILRGGETVGEERGPGIAVYVTQRRVLNPALMAPGREEPDRRREIEVP